MAENTSPKTHQNFIGGKWKDSISGQIYPVSNPAHTSQVIGKFQSSLPQDAENAIAAAHAASNDWAKMPAPQRGAILYKALEIFGRRARELAESITIEEGKPKPNIEEIR